MRPRPSRLSRLPVFVLSALCGVVAVLAVPAVASADTTLSENWSGYAVHRSGMSFRSVSASWTQPSGTCTQGDPTYSAFWVGLGGYNLNSDALEQIGTELDCNPNGTQVISAWYELVPAPSRPIQMTVGAGDQITATVTVVGKKVTLAISDKTRHESFTKTITDHTIDVSSAEWITEAPSECNNANQCQTLPLTDFGSVQFSGATAETTKLKRGTISSVLWDRTEILLGSSGSRFISTVAPQVSAQPSALASGGRAFTVAYTAPNQPPPNQPPILTGGGGGGPSGSDGTRSQTRASAVSGHQRLVEGVGRRTG